MQCMCFDVRSSVVLLQYLWVMALGDGCERHQCITRHHQHTILQASNLQAYNCLGTLKHVGGDQLLNLGIDDNKVVLMLPKWVGFSSVSILIHTLNTTCCDVLWDTAYEGAVLSNACNAVAKP